jgi:hypothetical protein
MQIHESDLTFLSTLGAGASSTVYKALLIRQGGKLPGQPKYVAVKKISNLNEVCFQQFSSAPCSLQDRTGFSAGFIKCTLHNVVATISCCHSDCTTVKLLARCSTAQHGQGYAAALASCVFSHRLLH